MSMLFEFFPDAALAPDEVRETLLKLVAAHYVERCPAPQPVIALPTEEESAAKRRASKSAKVHSCSCQNLLASVESQD